jgi:subtilisin family serine protease
VLIKKTAAVVCLLVLFSASSSFGFMENYDNKITLKAQIAQIPEIVSIPHDVTEDHKISRYLVFGRGPINDIHDLAPNSVSSIVSDNGFFSIVILPEQSASALGAKGYSVIKDFPLEFHKPENEKFLQMDQIRKFTGSDLAQAKYNYTGRGVNIAIVDTGVDFSNPDMQGSLARDKNNRPIMLDPDGQGLILTNATFAANIDKNGLLENTTKASIEKITKMISKNVTSTVYLTKSGVFLNLKQNGKGTTISIYNSFFPASGPSPIFNGTITDDYKIGKSNRDYIKSASGVYHFGMIYQGAISGPFASVQVVPVLVVDSQIPGVYDTVIPDMSTSWNDYTRFNLQKGQKPKYDFDFTDETPIKLGAGKEFLVYDSDKDGKLDYSAGTVGAQVLDIYGIIAQNKSAVDKILRATNGTLLPGLDPAGNFFGVMTDFVGHGTSAAASIASKGGQQYDIYNNTKTYTLPGVATGAKIIPIKALWFGDTVYGWLWSAGFDNKNSTWTFSGKPRADIISNSWGISNFPSLNTSPGVDVLSLIVSVLSVPHSVDPRYPGVTIVSSAGNAGHGYGTMSLPNAAPFGITVGATTNNVYVGYGGFAGQPRFGNTTTNANDVIDFSSRGPSIIGDPKPDLMNTGAYGFTPKTVLKANPTSKAEPFSLFGGTSMAAPLTAGTAAILMQSLKEKNQDYDPFTIKNILMSTATDLKNDPFTQGAGLVNAYKAVRFVNGKDGIFVAYNNSTYYNIKKILDVPIMKLNSTSIGLDEFALPDKTLPQTSWFAGRLSPGERSSTYYTIENPNNSTLSIQIIPQYLKLIEKSEFNSATKLRLQDSLYNKTGTYRPDYIKLTDVKKHDSLSSFYENTTIPKDTSLMVLNLNFAFNDFMNKTEKTYAADTKIASLYLYDWSDKNKDKKVSSDELSLVNRGGSWGTVQELRVSDPQSKLKNTPLVGIYPVPTRYSYWLGETKKNSTEMSYVLSASYYKKEDWKNVWLDTGLITVPPFSSASVAATITVPNDTKPGLYQGFLSFVGQNHTINAPVSFAVTSPVKQKDKLIIISSSKNTDVLYGNGYVKGAFDMVNRYNAGDWRQYYFDIKDSTVNAASIDISWKEPDTNFSVFMIDPKGRIVQTNVPPGVFGQFMDWPTSDWLGTSLFSEGGGFYPVKNKDNTSTLLYTQINQTGTYTLLVHSTLFGGKATTEPFSVIARFSTILEDDTPPQITLAVPAFVNASTTLTPTITDESKFSVRYFVDDMQTNFNNSTLGFLDDGPHNLRIEATDEAGNTSVQFYSFVVDKTSPNIVIKSPANNTRVSDKLIVDFTVDDSNPANKTAIILAGQTIQNKTQAEINVKNFTDGTYQLVIFAKDKADNKIQKTLTIAIGQIPITGPTQSTETGIDQNLVFLIIAGVAAIATASVVVLATKSRKPPK